MGRIKTIIKPYVFYGMSHSRFAFTDSWCHHCPKCGKWIENTQDRYCGHCGTRLWYTKVGTRILLLKDGWVGKIYSEDETRAFLEGKYPLTNEEKAEFELLKQAHDGMLMWEAKKLNIAVP